MPKEYFEDCSVGDRFESPGRTITETDVVMFAAFSGDWNAVHTDIESAEAGYFGERIAHGMLSGGLISAVIGTQLPGPGTIYMQQTLTFMAPVYAGDTIQAQVEVVAKLEKKRVRLKTTCRNQDDVVVLDGEALVSPPRPIE